MTFYKPKQQDDSALKTAAIIGGGVIGGGWLARFMLNGWDVRMYDPDPDCLRKVEAVLANARHALPMLYDFALPTEGQLIVCATLAEAVVGADWIQESVPERLDIKHATFTDIQAHCEPGAIIGSSTSGFKPSQLQDSATAPAQIIVTHPFNPVYLLPLIELVPSAANSEVFIERAQNILRGLGFYPLRVRKEIDAHIADRFLEAVWREGLWLVKDGIATTAEIDDAIRYGFGLRWAQMGLFETFRIAGGEAGMKHFIAQFGPCLGLPWTKLMDVPDLTEELTEKIAAQSDAQSQGKSIRDLERLRDNNLIVMIRALKQQNSAAGALLNQHEAGLRPVLDISQPMITVSRHVPVDWTDYNGHMNEGRYGQVFSDAADAVMVYVGADAAYIKAGQSYFTVETTVKYLAETHAGQSIKVHSRVTVGAGKKLGLFHEMLHADGTIYATCAQLMIHVDLESRRSSLPSQAVQDKVEALFAAHTSEMQQ